MNTEADATVEDVEDFFTPENRQANAASSSGDVVCKAEVVEKTREDEIKEQFELITKCPKPEITNLTSMRIDEEGWLVEAKANPFAVYLVTQLTLSVPQIASAVQVLEDIVRGEPLEKAMEAQTALVTMIEGIKIQHLDMKKWAITFGILAPDKGSKRSRENVKVVGQK